MSTSTITQAMILAAGKGTRLRPYKQQALLISRSMHHGWQIS